MIQRVLVANRGEIACRIIRTLRALGKDACAIYSDVDEDAPHVRLADDARPIGRAPAADSYLNVVKVVTAACDMGCDAVHPGYGFLSESAAFAEACTAAGLVFIGPPPDAIRRMGDKAEARRVAEKAGVSPVPGYGGPDDDATLALEARRIGYPLLVKAAMGGGGKGMRKVGCEAELEGAIAAARREAQGAFGDSRLMLERYIHPSRHIEVQILADTHGQVASVLERECSLQRRHQKVVEECPSPAVDEGLRARLSDAAVKLAKAVDYVGAGTIELLVEEDGSFWFLEMNTRLQVEHGVTEMVTGEDLVQWQIAIAEGARLADGLPEVLAPRGWAVEARVYAENPESGFLPQVGHLDRLALPGGPGVRVDCGVREGQEVTRHYDPLLMKIVAGGRDREHARGRLVAALRDLHVIGPATNIAYLIDVLEGDAFREGKTFTHTLETSGVPVAPDEIPQAVLALAALSLTKRGPDGLGREDGLDRWSPYDRLGDFRLVPPEGAS
ncbi:MAG: ATP-grasp domain-containing protein [Planctomycetes bacterium]|nr:ATP-grasp domain-containing protein [Planctomycetota bacterium]